MNLSIPRPFLCALLGAGSIALSAAAFAQGGDEVPFITSPDNVTLEMLRISKVGPRDHVLDLGSGDGRIVILAAKRFGATGLGVEIVPDLVEQSLRSAQKAGVAKKVNFLVQDLFKTDLAQASVITMYLLPEVNMQLRPELLKLKPGTRLVSHDWDMGDWQPDQTVVLPVPDKTVGLEKSSKVHLWVVPARVDGLWCGAGKARDTQLRVTQKHQMFTATLTTGKASHALAGDIQGTQLRSSEGTRMALEGNGELRLTSASRAGPASRLKRAQGAACSA